MAKTQHCDVRMSQEDYEWLAVRAGLEGARLKRRYLPQDVVRHVITHYRESIDNAR